MSDFAARNEGQYLRAELTYPPLFSGDDTLRPHLLLEFTFADVRLTTEQHTVNTIIEDVLKVDAIFSPIQINCISSNETAIEKWVGLTRRIAAIERKCHYDDTTLIRHVYDLNAIEQANRIKDVFFELANIVVFNDAKQFKNQHPEYYSDPAREIRQSITILKINEAWKERYRRFTSSMVYDKTAIPDYDKAVQSLEKLSNKVIDSLEIPP